MGPKAKEALLAAEADMQCIREFTEDAHGRLMSQSGRRQFPLKTDEVNGLVSAADPLVVRAARTLAAGIDRRNAELATAFNIGRSVGTAGISASILPLNRVGLYVPRRNLASLITWASAVRAAGVAELVVYLPAEAETGVPAPEVVAVALDYSAEIVCGPARYGFPALAFGVEGELLPTEIVCGPAGTRLNRLKLLSATLAGCRVDFFAGPSDIACIALDLQSVPDCVLEIDAQLEHGPDSVAHLIVVATPERGMTSAYQPAVSERIKLHSVPSIACALSVAESIVPEIVVISGGSPRQRAQVGGALHNYGVCYLEGSAVAGDYLAVGRGCADPTGSAARIWSGLSPLTFARVPVCVKDAAPASLADAAEIVARWEGLTGHIAALSAYFSRQNNSGALEHT